MQIKLAQNESEVNKCALLMSSSEPFITLQFTFDKCKSSLQGDYKELYIATIDGQFTGFVIIQLYGLLRGYIQTLCIEEQFRSQGIGTLLIQHSEERISKISPNVFICVSSFNHRAFALYKRRGFEQVGTLKDHIVKGFDEYLLRKSSGPFAEFVPIK